VERERDLAPVRDVLAEGLAELGISAEPAVAQLERLCALVSQWAARLNLTAHREPEAIARRLVLDALALGMALPGGAVGPIADLGSGAGFPGLPIAAVWSGAELTLIEARERRHHFQRTCVRELGLSNVHPLLGRAEELPTAPHRVVVAQAMAQPATALAWMRRWAAHDGWLALPLSESQAAFEPPAGVRFQEMRAYRVPLDGAHRRIWIGRVDPA
jgi:16S rRNA (guanine527-N7)-methyltransferase